MDKEAVIHIYDGLLCSAVQSRHTLPNPKDCGPQGSSVPGFSRQEYWSRLPLRTPGTMEYYSAIKRNIFEPVILGWMNLEPIIQSEVSQKEKSK